MKISVFNIFYSLITFLSVELQTVWKRPLTLPRLVASPSSLLTSFQLDVVLTHTSRSATLPVFLEVVPLLMSCHVTNTIHPLGRPDEVFVSKFSLRTKHVHVSGSGSGTGVLLVNEP